MTQWERIEDLPQAEGCESAKSWKTQSGHKDPQKQSKKERKAGENKKTKESGEREPDRG
jgi:hypothetical protein